MSPWMIQQDHAAVRTVQQFVVQNLNPLHCLLLGCCLAWMLCMSSCGCPTWAFFSYFLHWCLESGVTGKAFKMLSSSSHLFVPELLCPGQMLMPLLIQPAKSHVLQQMPHILTGSVLTAKTTWQKVIAEVGLVDAELSQHSQLQNHILHIFFNFHKQVGRSLGNTHS